MISSLEETSKMILPELDQKKIFFAFKRLFSLGFKLKNKQLREVRHLRSMIMNMDRASRFNRNRLEELIEENYGQNVNERGEYDIGELKLHDLSRDFKDNISRIFATLYLFESASMNLIDLFVNFKGEQKQFEAFKVNFIFFLIN